MKFPPFSFLFYPEKQPNRNAWVALLKLSNKWNSKHESQFILSDDEELELVFHAGIEDPEIQSLYKDLLKLQKKLGIIWFSGIQNTRTFEDYLNADYIQFISDGYGAGFHLNEELSLSFGNVQCEKCGSIDGGSEHIIAPIIIDESFLQKENEINRENNGGLDFINLANGTTLVTKRIKEIFEANQYKGISFSKVINSQTNEASDELFIISAIHSILSPCPEDTQRVDNAICDHCGAHNDTVGNYFYAQKSQVGDLDLFSNNRFGVTDLFFSKRVYKCILSEGITSLTLVDGINVCEH